MRSTRYGAGFMLAMALSGPWAGAQTPVLPSSTVGPVEAPRLDVHPAGLQNLGSLGPREKRFQAYTFHNRSTLPISLRIADAPQGLRLEGPALLRPLEPGETLGLNLEVDAASQTGWLKRRVRLVTDDPKQGAYILPIEASVRPDLSVDALRRSLPPVHVHESPEMVFHFVRETGDPLALNVLSGIPPYLEVAVNAEKGRGELRVVLRASKVDPGLLRGLEILRVGTNVPGQTEVTLYLDWRLLPLLEAEPARLVFQGQEPMTLRLRQPEGKPFDLSEVQLEGEGFSAENLEGAPSAEKRILVRRNRLEACNAFLRLRISGESECLRVPLIGLPAGH